MNKYFRSLIFILTLCIIFGFSIVSAFAEPTTMKAVYAPDVLLVKFMTGTDDVKMKNIHKAIDAVELAEIPKIHVKIIKLTKGYNIEKAIAHYKKMQEVEYAEPDYTFSASKTPNDTYYKFDQGNLKKINMPTAWDVNTGVDHPVTVAVIDTGVNYNHPDMDLAGKVIKGHNYINNTENPLDDDGHGSNVASIIASESNNNSWISGINWGAKILAIKALDSEGYGDSSDIASGISEAVSKGAKIINLSLGGKFYSQTMKDAIDNARANGVLVFAAAGNESSTISIQYPFAYSGVIGVGATNTTVAQEIKADFSNSNRFVDLSAPGVYIPGIYKDNTSYYYYSGTSQATPHVAGLASLLMSHFLTKTPDEVTRIIQETAADLGTAGWDSGFGNGRIDAGAAMTASVSSAEETDNAKLLYTGNWTNVFAVGASGGTYKKASTPSDYVSIDFSGTKVFWFGPKGMSFGNAEVFIDNVSQGIIDLYKYYPDVNIPTDQQQLIFAKKGIAAGNHTLKIVPTGTRNASSSGMDVGIDAIDVFGTFQIDVIPPDAPTNFVAAPNPNTASLAWTVSPQTDVAGYYIFRSNTSGIYTNALNANPIVGNSYQDQPLTNATQYFYNIKAVDNVGNLSTVSQEVYVTPQTDGAPTVAPTGLVGEPGYQLAQLSWNANNAEIDFKGYNLYRSNGGEYSLVNTANVLTSNFYTDDGITNGTAYTYIVKAVDFDNNEGPASDSVTVTPAGIAVEETDPNISYTRTWSNASDVKANGGKYKYTENEMDFGDAVYKFPGTGISWVTMKGPNMANAKVYIDDVEMTTVNLYKASNEYNVKGYSITGLTPDTHKIKVYQYPLPINPLGARVVVDGFNVAGSDTTAPGAPTGLAASIIMPLEINLSWTAPNSIDVSSYIIEHSDDGVNGWSQVGTSNAISYIDTGLASGSTQYYRVKAVDKTSNISSVSNIVNATAVSKIKMEQDKPSITTVGTWNTGSNASYSGGTNLATNVTGNTATLSFNGTSVAWYGVKNGWRGISNVYIDNVLKGTVDAYAPTTLFQQKLYEKTGLASGSHTLKIEATGTKNVSSTGTYVDIDYFEVSNEPDTQAPTAPTNLAATAVSSSQIDLTWTASTDNVGVTGYSIERSADGSTGWAEVGTSVSTSYSNNGLSAGTIYYYRVKAKDAANNISGASTVVNATTPIPDTTPPNAPSNLTATAVSGSQIDLSWSASTDNVGVTGYIVERSADGSTGWTSVGTPTGTNFSNTGLAANTTYFYKVKAKDAVSNESSYSTVANATTQAVTTTKVEQNDPTITTVGTWNTGSNASYSGGTNLATNVTGNTATLSFNGTSVAWYGVKNGWRGISNIYIDNVLKGTVDAYAPTTLFQQKLYEKTGLASGSHTLKIEATGTKNASSTGTYVDIDYFEVSNEPDTQAPSIPTNLIATAVTSSQIDLTWTASTDNVGVTGYSIESSADGSTGWAEVGTSVNTSYSNTGLSAGTTYYYRVKAKDAATNISGASAVANATTQTPDTTPPNAPNNLTATAVSGSQIDLSWSASTDNVGVTGYIIERSVDGSTGWTSVGTPTGTSYSNTGLTANTIYYYRIKAKDAASNESSYSTVANATTAAVTTTKIEQNDPTITTVGTWSASSNASYSGGTNIVTNVTGSTATIAFNGTSVAWYGVKNGWRGISNVYIDNVLKGTVDAYAPTTLFQQKLYEKTGLSSGSHTLKIEATGTKNASSTGIYVDIDYFEVTNEPDMQVPATPTNLAATAVSSSQIDLTWTASTDNVGVTGYSIERSADGSTGWAEVGTSITTSYSNTGLSAGTIYYYRVKAKDAATNISGASAVANATTQTPDTTPPNAPSNLTATAVSGSQIDLSWSASTDNVGVTGYIIERSADGSTGWTSVGTPTGTSYSNIGLTANTKYYYRIKAKDAANNISGYSSTANATTQTVTTTKVEQNDPTITTVGTWSASSNASYSGGTNIVTNVTGSTATIAFNGTSVAWYGVKNGWRGISNVYIDNVLKGTVDAYAPTTLFQQKLYEKTGLASGSHTLKIEATGTKNASSTGTYVDIDYFEVTNDPDMQVPATPTNLAATAVSSSQIDLTWTASTDNVGVTGYSIESSADGSTGWAEVGTSITTSYSNTGVSAGTTYYYRVKAKDAANNISGASTVVNATTPSVTTIKVEQNDPTITTVGTWSASSNASYSGGTNIVTNVTGIATFTFNGTSVAWYGVKNGWRGISNVYIDNVLKGTVDAYAPTTLFQQKLYEKTGLASGSHTLKIEATGTKNASSTGTYVDIDYFEVSSN